MNRDSNKQSAIILAVIGILPVVWLGLLIAPSVKGGLPEINFLPISCYDRLVNTIHQNEWDDDEFAAGGFTVSNAKTIHAPAISEAFLTMECTLKEIQDLSGAGITAMVIGQVQRISVEETYAQGYEQRYGKDGFMLLVPAPQDLVTGEPNQSAIATVHIEKYD